MFAEFTSVPPTNIPLTGVPDEFAISVNVLPTVSELEVLSDSVAPDRLTGVELEIGLINCADRGSGEIEGQCAGRLQPV